jgi:predicted nucleic acid-binding protein
MLFKKFDKRNKNVTKHSVYLDTTIPSYLFEEREELKAFVQITRQWWAEERQNFEVYMSEETLAELNDGNYPNKDKVLASVFGIPILLFNPRIREVVQVYIDNYLMPRTLQGDARHLAYASVYQMDFLVTWNCNHLANANKLKHIQTIHARLGLHLPQLVTPLQLFKEKIP